MPTRIRNLRQILPAVLLILAACDALTPTVPTLTPTRAISGPTREFTPTIDARPPTRDVEAVVGAPGQNSDDTANIPAESNAPPFSVTPLPGAAPPPGNSSLVQITLEDGTVLLGALYEAPTNPATLIPPPGVLLLAPDREGWGDLPGRLNDAGLTVLAVEPRAGSTSADISTMLQAFSALNSVDVGSIGVIGAEVGADLALIGCAVNVLCDTLALITPLNADLLLNLMVDYNPRALLIAAGEDDEPGDAAASALIQAATPESGYQRFSGRARGTALVAAEPTLVSLLVEWMAIRLGA